MVNIMVKMIALTIMVVFLASYSIDDDDDGYCA